MKSCLVKGLKTVAVSLIVVALLPTLSLFFYGLVGLVDTIRWKDSLALFAAGSSGLAAIATLSTLLYLAFQGKNQQAVWNMQTHQLHRDYFSKSLFNLEAEIKITFNDKEGLYIRLFPESRLKKGSIRANIDFIKEIEEHHGKSREHIASLGMDEHKNRHISGYISSIHKLYSLINLERSEEITCGDIYDFDKELPIINIFSFQKDLECLQSALSRILWLCDEDKDLRLLEDLKQHKKKLLKHLSVLEGDSHYKLKLIDPVLKTKKKAFDIIMLYTHELCIAGRTNWGSIYNRWLTSMDNKDKIEELFENNNLLEKTLKTATGLRAIRHPEDKDKINNELEEAITSLKRENDGHQPKN